ncbi:MAG: ferrous iron transport protein B [Desulfobulbaceae bacterium]|nr:ferrous iron transport protein B [Desulfobulbaceae bacterium]
MIDVAKHRGIHIDTNKLTELTGVLVMPLVARNGNGVNSLLSIVQEVSWAGVPPRILPYYGPDIDKALNNLVPLIEKHKLFVDIYPARWIALKILEKDEQIVAKIIQEDMTVGEELLERSDALARHLAKTIKDDLETVIANHRYDFVRSILKEVIQVTEQERVHTSDKIDNVVNSRVTGPLLMASVLFVLYSFTFNGSSFLVDWLTILLDLLSNLIDVILPDGRVQSMIISGVIDGVGGVLGFVPIIMFMFFAIAVLEDSGYLTRVAFMMDRIFHFFGLHGSSVMPFIIAGGCAVPAVMATRTLHSPKERIATLLTVPFMNCGAKLPALTVIIAAFFPAHQALYMLLATVITWIVALMVAKLLRMTLLKGEPAPFVMELPPYRIPTLNGLFIHTWERTWQYIKKAGTVILSISILLWAMMAYPDLPAEKVRAFTTMRQDALSRSAGNKELLQIERLKAEAALRHSVAGRVGVALEPVSHLAGFDWRTNIALVGGFAAKEVIISTLGTAYSLGEVSSEDSTSLKERLSRDKHWNPATALAFLFFIMFYSPCLVTAVTIAREANSWKWAFFSIGFNTLFAFSGAVGIFQLGMLFGVGRG